MRILKFIILIILFASFSYFGQGKKIKWKRDIAAPTSDVQLFHSTHAINFPTSETLQAGDWEFEISHRFIPTIKDGSRSLFGFDGPVNMRIALAYAFTNTTLLTFGRSNTTDNYDITLKYKFFQHHNKNIPLAAALNAGAAWNTQVQNRDATNGRNFQYFAQVVLNTLINKKFGLGVVPSFVYNSHIYCIDKQYSFTLGAYAQFYINDIWSLAAESNSTVTGWRSGHNSVSFFVELETGGHFFKIILTNNVFINTTQFVEGATDSFNEGNLHFGFMITRLLKF